MVVTLRGIRYRPGRSLVVVLLSAVAVAAGVLAPAYARAAQQSILSDRLSEISPPALGLAVQSTAQSVAETNGKIDPLALGLDEVPTLTAIADRQVAAQPLLHKMVSPAVGVAETPIVLQSGGAVGGLAYRPQACEHVSITAGRCPKAGGEVILSVRSADEIHVKVGAKVPVLPEPRVYGSGQFAPGGGRRPVSWLVVGTYEPRDPTDLYWGLNGNFNYHPAVGQHDELGFQPARLDAMFVASPGALWAWTSAPYRITIEYQLDGAQIRLDDVDPLMREIQAINRGLGGAAKVETALPVAADRFRSEDQAVARSIPLVALPLLLFCWFVLFLAVAAMSEERGAEIALGRLRGFRIGQVSRFSMAEPLLLIAVGALPGMAAGYWLAGLAAEEFMAPGVTTERRWPLLVGAAVALAGGVLATFLANRRTARTGVLALLRRVPTRSGWRSATAEVAVGMLAAVAVVQIMVAGDKSGPLTYVAPPLVAIIAGLAAARLVQWLAATRARYAGRRGKLRALLAAVQVGRRPGIPRLVTVITVAVALLTFAATVWDVSRINRDVSAAAELGAPTVYQVQAAGPRDLMQRLETVDPAGTKAMAVTGASTRYNDSVVKMVGFDAARFRRIGVWPDREGEQVEDYLDALREPVAPSINLSTSRIEVDVTAAALPRDRRVNLALLVTDGVGGQRTVVLGRLSAGPRTYTGQLDCAACRLLDLVVSTYGGSGTFQTTFTVTAMRVDGQPMAGQPIEAAGWRRASSLEPAQQIRAADDGGLAVQASGDGTQDLLLERADTPAAIPVIVAGGLPAEDAAATEFNFLVFGRNPQSLQAVRRVPQLPGAGSFGFVFDLRTEVLGAERLGGQLNVEQLRYQVWASAAVGEDFDQQLAAAGLLVTSSERMSRELDLLNRAAPALALRLYLFAGIIAVILAAGVVLLSALVSRRTRRDEMQALRTSGVRAAILRGGLRREYLTLLGYPSLIGVIAGLAGAALILPTIPLVSVDAAAAPVYKIGLGWLPGALALLAVSFLLVVAAANRLVHGTRRRHGGVTNSAS